MDLGQFVISPQDSCAALLIFLPAIYRDTPFSLQALEERARYQLNQLLPGRCHLKAFPGAGGVRHAFTLPATARQSWLFYRP